VIKLDPAVASRGHLVKRWGLWANVGMAEKRDAE
jgi:predicted transcriptional regulator of viral defense system